MADDLIEMDPEVLRQIQTLVQCEEQSASVAKDDTILGAHVLMLSNPNTEIAMLALQNIHSLAKWPQNRFHLKKFLCMSEQLDMLLEHDDLAVKQLAKTVIDMLNKSENKHHKAHDHMTKVSRRRSIIGAGNKSKTLIFQIKGMHDKEDLEVCRNCILTVKGVISITFNHTTKRAVLRTKPELKPEDIAKAVHKTMTMAAEQVIKNELGDEELVSFKLLHTTAAVNPADTPLPDYPSDEESPSHENSHNLARIGDNDNEAQNGWGFVRKVSDFISSSFYW